MTLGVEGADVVRAVPPAPHRLDAHAGAGRFAQLVFHGGDLWRPAAGRAVREAIVAFDPDVVHSHVVTGMSVQALRAPSRAGVAHVHTLHDYWLCCWRSTLTRRGQRRCGTACAALATARVSALRRHGPHVMVGISEAALAAHPPAIRRKRQAVVLRHPAAPAPDPVGRRADSPAPVFGFLGQLNPNKGVRTFLEVARSWTGPGRFVVAGRGRLDAEVAGCDRVENRGWVSGTGKEDFFAELDCLVVPSVWPEPAGLVVGEAVVRGVPVVVARSGGLPEYVPESCRPLLFPAGDVAALRDRLAALSANRSAYAVGPADALTWDEHLDAVIATYEQARAAARTT